MRQKFLSIGNTISLPDIEQLFMLRRENTPLLILEEGVGAHIIINVSS